MADNDILAKYGVDASASKSSNDDDILKKYGVATPKPDKGIIANALDKLDSYTGAPSRALVGGLQQGKGLLGSLKEFGAHFGGDNSTAPTGKDIQKGFGIDDATLKEVMSGGSGLMKLGGLVTRKDDPIGKVNFPELLINSATDYSNVLPLGKGIEATASLAGKGAQALKLGEVAAKGGQLLDKALSSDTLLKGLLGAAGVKAHGLEGLVVSQLLEPLVREGYQGSKAAGKGLLNALKGGEEITELTKGPFKNFPPNPSAPLLTTKKAAKIPLEDVAAGLLRAKMAEERAQP